MSASVQREDPEGAALVQLHRAFFRPGGRGRAAGSGGPAEGGSRPAVSLDTATELVTGTHRPLSGDLGGWVLTTYGTAGEAVIRRAARKKAAKPVADPDTGEVLTPEPDPERSMEEAARRAQARLRRYAVANRLKFMWTLTYGADDRLSVDLERVRVDVDRMVRRLRRDRHNRPFPWCYVVEPHKDGALHVHFLVGFFIDWRKMRERWGQGHVFVSDPRKTLADHGGQAPTDNGLANARRAASYAAKYLGKGFSEGPRDAGGHRYEVAQGFEPARDDRVVRDAQDGRDTAAAIFRRRGWCVFASADREDWPAPPIELWFFDGRPPGSGGRGGTGPPSGCSGATD